MRRRVHHLPQAIKPKTNPEPEPLQDASEEDLARCDGVCIICREEMAPAARNKKLPCGHVFHLHCLRCAAPAMRHCVCPGSSTSQPASTHLDHASLHSDILFNTLF